MKPYLKSYNFRLYSLVIFLLISYLSIKHETYLIKLYESISLWLYPADENRNGELLKVILSILGALGILFGIYISYRRAKAIEQGVLKQGEALNIQSDQIELTRKSQTDERFKNAVEHLGHEKEPIILGGVAELHQIAKENEDEYSEIIFNILCSYIRTNSRKKDKSINVIQTIVDFLFSKSKNSPYLGLSANLKNSDLLGINFIECNLESAILSECRVSKIVNCNLKDAILVDVEFFCPEVRNVNFTNAEIHRTIFYSGEIENCNFNILNDYNHNRFVGGDLKNVNFDNLKLSDWEFISVNMINCSFNNSEMISTIIVASVLERVDFVDIELFSRNDFRATQFIDVKMNKLFVSKSNFKGVRTERGFRSPFFKELSTSIGVKTDMSGIDFTNTIISEDCEISELTENDVNEIMGKYESVQKIIFPKAKSSRKT